MRTRLNTMKIEKLKDKIICYEPYDFNVRQTLDCGQIFRYVIDGDKAHVWSQDKMATLTTYKEYIEITTQYVDYFHDFFDFDTDYSSIKETLKKDAFLSTAVDYGYGIRILNNDCYEMIVSFIISANNNITRIKRSIEYLCLHFGTNMGEYYAFPTLEQLKDATIEDYISAGLGYRSSQLYDTVQRLSNADIDRLKDMSKDDQFNYLVSLKGIGEKVANCILLFGLQARDVFPVDTWINKVYNTLTNRNETNRKIITKELTERYGSLSGYAQQYFFYYFRDQKLG